MFSKVLNWRRHSQQQQPPGWGKREIARCGDEDGNDACAHARTQAGIITAWRHRRQVRDWETPATDEQKTPRGGDRQTDRHVDCTEHGQTWNSVEKPRWHRINLHSASAYITLPWLPLSQPLQLHRTLSSRTCSAIFPTACFFPFEDLKHLKQNISNDTPVN